MTGEVGSNYGGTANGGIGAILPSPHALAIDWSCPIADLRASKEMR
jgi:hypothetical protein